MQILRRYWEYGGRGGECQKDARPEPQLTLLFTAGRYLCSPEKSVPWHSITDWRISVCRCVTPTHRELPSKAQNCSAGRAGRHWAWTHGMVSSGWIAPCWVPGRASLAGGEPTGLPGAGVQPICRCSARAAAAPEGFRWPRRWWYPGEKRKSERDGECSSPGKLRMKREDCAQAARQRDLWEKLGSCLESLVRNKWKKRPWMIIICKCHLGIKNNQKGK